ncbi:MAG TPA: exodeoxyribonuclease VII large subunit [Candidatus Saccharimonadales bacterium]|nr:exodeoxyribonuclease VII large subunit [Candidatus Saccharimonadales bacterium]
MSDLVFSVSDFVAVLNQTMEFAYPSVNIVGELANFRVSKNRWVYFDLKDEDASIKFFGTIYQLPGPLEDGLMIQVRGVPRLHPQYGFSVNVQFMSPVGDGSLKKAAALLEAKLTAEGLFELSRKRSLPYPPKTIGLIASAESAAYHDFIKIINERWGGVEVRLADVQVQGEVAPSQIVMAINYFNGRAEPVDVLIITRGGGSAEDLAAFNTELVTRAIAGSRIPTLVAIGHEVNLSLAELAADQRASTPSNAAQLITPDKKEVFFMLQSTSLELFRLTRSYLSEQKRDIRIQQERLTQTVGFVLGNAKQSLDLRRQVITALSPTAVLARGYTILRQKGKVIRSASKLQPGASLLQFGDGSAQTTLTKIKVQ